MKARIQRIGKFILCVFLALVFVAGISAGVNQGFKPSSEEKRAEVLQILAEGGLQEVLSDGQYDETYLMMELKGTDIESLMDFVRPIEISIIDKEGNILGQAIGTGFLMERYVLTSPVLFSFLANPEIQAALMAGEIGIDIKLCPNDLQDDSWKVESLDILGIGKSVVVLGRGETLIFPTPVEFPFRMGRIEDLNLGEREDIFCGIGSLDLGSGRKVLHPYRGEFEFARVEMVGLGVISSAIFTFDVGGPVFAVRDGELELIGLLQFGEGGKAWVIDMRTILDEMKQGGLETNIKFKE